MTEKEAPFRGGRTEIPRRSLLSVLGGGFLAGLLPRTADAETWGTEETVVATFTADRYHVVRGEPVTFDASKSDNPGGSIQRYEWSFGDGQTATGTSVEHTFAAASEHDISLTVHGETKAATATMTVPVREAPPDETEQFTCFVLSDSHYGTGSRDTTQKLIEQINGITGTALPDGAGGGTIENPTGVIHPGDMTDHGSDSEWDAVMADFGTDGTDGLLDYPVYYGLGNHDLGLRDSIAQINENRTDVAMVSESGQHVSWDWGPIHFVHLGLFAGNDVGDAKSKGYGNHGGYDPEGALDFLKRTIDSEVGQSGRPIALVQHYDFDSWGKSWWNSEARAEFAEYIDDYNATLIITGHNHRGGIGHTWNGIRWLSGDNTGSGSGYAIRVEGDHLGISKLGTNGLGGETFEKQMTMREVTNVNTTAARFSVEPGQDGTTITFDASASVDTTGTIERYAWEFGDGSSDTGETVEHTYDSTGDYDVTLTVTNDSGKSAEVTQTVPTGRGPYNGPHEVPGRVQAEDFDIGQDAYYDTSGANEGGNYRDTTVDISTVDGVTYVGWIDAGEWWEYTVEAAEAGTYEFTARVATGRGGGTFYVDVDGSRELDETSFDGDGWHNWKTVTAGELSLSAGTNVIRIGATEDKWDIDWFEIREPDAETPSAAFVTETNERTVSLDAIQSSSPNGSISRYEWDFGDSASGTGETVEHTYDTSGFYDVTLTVTDEAGKTAETTTEVAVGETHEIRIDGLSDREAGYEFSVSGTLEKGEDATEQDTVEGSTVSGKIGSGQDSYRYGGEITSWSLEKDVPVKITIDGEEVDQSTLGQSDDGGGDSDADEPESVSDAIDADDDGDFDDTEVLNAVEYWQDDEPVPGTDGQTIDDQTLLEIVDRWSDG